MAKKLLLIENEESFQESAEKALSRLGYDVVFASSYEDAIKLLETQKFDNIITDLFIPESIEGIGAIGKNLIEELEQAVSDPEIKQPFEGVYAPLGLYIAGMAFVKSTPVMMISASGRYDPDISFVRYAVIGKTGIFLEKHMQLRVEKNKESEWERLAGNLGKQSVSLLQVDQESRKEVFGV